MRLLTLALGAALACSTAAAAQPTPNATGSEPEPTDTVEAPADVRLTNAVPGGSGPLLAAKRTQTSPAFAALFSAKPVSPDDIRAALALEKPSSPEEAESFRRWLDTSPGNTIESVIDSNGNRVLVHIGPDGQVGLMTNGVSLGDLPPIDNRRPLPRP